MKVFKRNVVIITVLLFVCAAVYLNWSYNQKEAEAGAADAAIDKAMETVTDGNDTDAAETSGMTDGAGLYYFDEDEKASAMSDEMAEYFAEVRLERQAARDDASATLQTVASAEGASQETIDSALSQMTQIAEWTVKEAELENLITAKGFQDCVVYISDSGVSVTVAVNEGLSGADVAKITDVVTTETEFGADQLKVFEIK